MKSICPIAFPTATNLVTLSVGDAVAATFRLADSSGGTFNRYRDIFSLTLSSTKLKVYFVSANSLTGIRTPKLQSASALTRSTLFLCPHTLYGGAVSAIFGLAALCGGSSNRYRVTTSALELAGVDVNSSFTQGP
jgi:hypothetical protein